MLEVFPASVLGSARCGADIVSVTLTRPDGYSFEAGQWFRLTLDTPAGPQVRTFSHVSAPGDDWLEVTTRLSETVFKKALDRLTAGDEVTVSAPGGRLRLPSDDRVVFLVGGVGITPVRSMLRAAMQEDRRFEDALVIYGNRDETCEPYAGEIEQMRTRGVRLVLVRESAPEGWTGERGRITADLVRRHLPDDGRPVLVTGPPPMIDAAKRVLDELGIGRDRVTIEAFAVSKGS